MHTRYLLYVTASIVFTSFTLTFTEIFIVPVEVWHEPGVIIRRVLFAAGWREPGVVCYHI